MLYDYRDSEVVQDVILDDICDLIADIEDEYLMLRRFEYLVIIAHAELARYLIAIMADYFEEAFVDEDSHVDLLHDDDNEVLVSLSYDGAIFVEEPRCEDGSFKRGDAELTYIEDSYKRKDIAGLDDGTESILVFGFEDDVDDEDDYYFLSDDDDDGEPPCNTLDTMFCGYNCSDCPCDETVRSSVSVKVNGKEIKDVHDAADAIADILETRRRLAFWDDMLF